MSSAASRPQQAASEVTSPMVSPLDSQSNGQSAGPSAGQSANGQSSASASSKLRKPPSRPQLMGPPARPKPPAPAPSEPPAAVAPPPEPEAPAEPQPLGPIPVPSERMQYRAIGLLKGKYIASEEQLNRGDIALSDGTLIDAVLLGRVTSLIKKHVDLETEHLWVVYPRTLYKDENEPALHMQIVGVWEPETLNARKEDTDTGETPPILSSEEAEEKHSDCFSIRGEVAKYSEDSNEIVINIVQKSKSPSVKPKRPFKLLINGELTGRTVGYFWDLSVKREGSQLVLVSADSIAVVPPKKKSKDEKKRTTRRPSAGKPRTAPVPKPKPKSKSEELAKGDQSEADKVEEGKVEEGKAEENKAVRSTEAMPADTQPEATQIGSEKATDEKATDKQTVEEKSEEVSTAEQVPEPTKAEADTSSPAAE